MSLSKVIWVFASGMLLAGCYSGNHERQAAKSDETQAKAVEPPLMINFDKRYDVYLNITEPAGQKQLLVKDCLFVGFVGSPRHRPQKEAQAPKSGWGMSYSKTVTYDGAYLDTFRMGSLILQRSDGKLMYVKPEMVLYFEEARQ